MNILKREVAKKWCCAGASQAWRATTLHRKNCCRSVGDSSRDTCADRPKRYCKAPRHHPEFAEEHSVGCPVIYIRYARVPRIVPPLAEKPEGCGLGFP
jgi:hypothetical protein